MFILERLGTFFGILGQMAVTPMDIALLFSCTLLGIVFGALPGLTATLGVALLTTLTYGMKTDLALTALLSMYVGAIYGGSYSSILINIPGTAAAAATAMEGYPMACRGEAGRAIGLTTTASAIGTIIGMLFMVCLSPLVSAFALQFTSFEFFLLAFFGILISGTLACPDLVCKGWISGFIGLFLALVGRDRLQFYPRFTFGFSEFDGGIDIVPVLIGAFGIPQIIQVMVNRMKPGEAKPLARVVPEFGKIVRSMGNIVRSALIGVGIGSLPGIGEDVAAWVSYGAAKNASKHPERFGTGCDEGIVATETANNACIGGAIVPLLTLGIPGSPPAAMLLGALMLHNIAPGPMLAMEHPNFLLEVTAILFLAAVTMWIVGISLARHVVKVLTLPPMLFMPIVGLLCIIGSYSLGLSVFNLYLMLPVGILAYAMTELGYPIAPLVIGVILGPMADENLRRALMVSQGDFMPIFTRPVACTLFLVIILTFVSQLPAYKRLRTRLADRWTARKTRQVACETAADFGDRQ
jgi:putative tricarboxylic transport membrane protein